MPSRPLRLYEVQKIEDENEEVHNSRGIFYEDNNINGAICIFVNVSGQGHILGYDNDDEAWIELTNIDEEERSTEKFTDESDNIIAWIKLKYGEDGFGIYGMYDEEIPDR